MKKNAEVQKQKLDSRFIPPPVSFHNPVLFSVLLEAHSHMDMGYYKMS